MELFKVSVLVLLIIASVYCDGEEETASERPGKKNWEKVKKMMEECRGDMTREDFKRLMKEKSEELEPICKCIMKKREFTKDNDEVDIEKMKNTLGKNAEPDKKQKFDDCINSAKTCMQLWTCEKSLRHHHGQKKENGGNTEEQ